MTATSMGALLGHLRKIVDPAHGPSVSDGELLERFVRRRDETAFELLVWRHQRMVLGVCRRLLHDVHEAEDAFQAAFLTLARKAASVRGSQTVAGWLHTVAYRIALRARKGSARRAMVALDDAAVACRRDPAEAAIRREVAAALDAEVSRLPEKYRLAVVLCYLEGKTYPEASRQLGVPVGTLSARLTRARALLRTRLMRRGIDLSEALLAALLGEQAAAAAPAALVNATIKIATTIMAGHTTATGAVSTTVAELTEGVLRSMFLGQSKIAMAVGLTGLLVTGFGLFITGAATAPPLAPAESPRPPASLSVDKAKSIRADHPDGPLPAGALFRFANVRQPGYAGRTHSAYSPNGRLVAVGDERGRLDLWDAHTGRALRVLRREGPAIKKLAFTPNGLSLAEARADNTIQFWAVPSGEEQRLFRFGAEQGLFQMGSLTFSPDGRHLLIGGCQLPRLCEANTGKDRWRGNFFFEASAFSRDGKTLLVASGPFLVFLDATNGTKRGSLRLKTDTPDNLGIVAAMALSPGGQRLALGLHTGEVYLCDAQTGGEVTRFRAVERPREPVDLTRNYAHGILGQGVVWGLSFSPDGKWLSTSATDGGVRLWEIVTRREVLRLTGHKGYVHEVAFGTDNRTLLSCGEDAQAYLWSLRPPVEEDAKPSLDSLWSALADEPSKAYWAIWVMSESKDATAFLRGKIAPAKPLAKARLAKLIADLDSDQFAARESATKALAELGAMAVPALREALRAKPSPEARKRLEELVKRKRIEVKTLTPEELRTWRAIDVLERLDTAEARELLKSLAAGAPGALPTTAARDALKRLH